jgi:hypothetical protein
MEEPPLVTIGVQASWAYIHKCLEMIMSLTMMAGQRDIVRDGGSADETRACIIMVVRFICLALVATKQMKEPTDLELNVDEVLVEESFPAMEGYWKGDQQGSEVFVGTFVLHLDTLDLENIS